MKHFTLKPNRAACLALALAAGITGLTTEISAQTREARETELEQLLSSLRYYTERGTTEPARAEDEAPRLNISTDGVLRHLGVMPGHAIQPQRTAAGRPDETARYFVQDNKSLLGITSSNIDVIHLRTRQSASRSYVRLQQTYKGLPVFAAQMAIQLNSSQGVEYLSSDLALEVNEMDSQPSTTDPVYSAQQATDIVSAKIKAESPGVKFTASVPRLMIFAPSVFDESGPTQLVWELETSSEAEPDLDARWLVNAKSGEVTARYALSYSALNRQIRDSNNTTSWPGTLVRSEGDPASGITDVDNAYLFLGQVYNYYSSNHGRDSYDDAGATLNGTVRYCPSPTSCPWGNAQWNKSSQRMRFGNGYATDDVTGHEMTHAVTEHSSGLVYENQSGAINESLSDIFGEFIDLSNANGNDSAGVRWLMGEDLPGGSLRDMAFPTNRSDPDRLTSSFYVPAVPSGTGNNANDFGGVHRNSGVNNKLCYLLVDGDTFNGQNVTGMGIAPVSALYYEANANLLTSGSGWTDLFEALQQAAVNLGWSATQRNNLYRACRAVEIAAPDDLYVDGSSNCLLKNGFQTCLGFVGPFKTVIQGSVAVQPGDTLHIRGGSYNESLTFSEIATLRSYDGSAVIGK